MSQPHLKDRLTQEQLVHEGLTLNQQFIQTYFNAYELVQAFQNCDYVAFITALEMLIIIALVSYILLSTFRYLIFLTLRN